MIKKIFIAILICFSISFTNNTKVLQPKIWLFTKAITRGIIMKDDVRNNATNNQYKNFIYIQTQNKITWDSVQYNNKFYKVNATLITKAKTIVGQGLDDDKEIFINKKTNQNLYLIDVINLNKDFKNKHYTFTFYGKSNNKKFVYKTKILNQNLQFDLVP